MSQILISIIYFSLYVLWVIRAGHSWIFYFAFELLMICAVVKSHYFCKRATQKLRKFDPDAFTNDAYWAILIRYGVYIYTPRGAESIAVSFTINRFVGYLFSIIFLLMSRWVEATVCFANTFVSAQMAGWLDPTFFMREFAKKKENSQYEDISDTIEKLKVWVQTAMIETLNRHNK